MIYFAGKKSSPKPGFKSKQQPFSSACSAGTKPKIFPVSKTTALNKKPQTLSESNREHQVQQQQQQQPQQHQHTVRFFARFVSLFTFFYIFFHIFLNCWKTYWPVWTCKLWKFRKGSQLFARTFKPLGFWP